MDDQGRHHDKLNDGVTSGLRLSLATGNGLPSFWTSKNADNSEAVDVR